MLSFSPRRFISDTTMQAIQHFAKSKRIPGVNRVILTSSCKGGVGKSTVAVNTALALSEDGFHVGVFDANIYSPSVPQICNIVENPLSLTKDKKFLPISAYGIETISPGNGAEKDQALMWNSQFIPQLINQLLNNADWSDLDYLIIDAPPGTGDVLMAINDNTPIDGAILVTTPDPVSQADAIRNVDAFRKLNIPVIGVVKNFDGYVCPDTQKITKIFKEDPNVDVAKKYNYEVFASIPMDKAVSDSVDKGFPLVVAQPNSVPAGMFRQIAKRIVSKVPRKTEEEIEKERKKAEEQAKMMDELIQKLREEQEKTAKEEAKDEKTIAEESKREQIEKIKAEAEKMKAEAK